MTVSPPDEQLEVFPVLDTMRAVAALAVLTTHVAFQTGQYSETVWGTALARFDVGVAVFFVLSGFLLTRPFLLAARSGRPSPSLRRYLKRRGLRIMPVYVVTVVLALTLLPENAGASLAEWVRNLTLTDIYVEGALPHGLSQMWSLSAEVAFYLLLPLLMVTVRLTPPGADQIRWALGLLAAAFLLNVVWILQALDGVALPTGALQWLPSYALWFAAGMALSACQVEISRAATPHPIALAAARIGRLPGSSLALALFLFLAACTPLAGPTLLYLPTVQQALVKVFLYTAIATALVLPGVFARDTRFARVLSWTPLRHLGHISYSIFCIHLIVLALVIEALDLALFSGRGLLVFALTLPITIIASDLLYWWVERPFMRLAGRPSTSTAAATSPTASTTSS